MPDYAIPLGYNTLDDQPFDNAHPASSWSGRELVHNDRLLDAMLRRNLLCMAWDINTLPLLNEHIWYVLAIASGMTSPISLGEAVIEVCYRAQITAGCSVDFIVSSSATERNRGFVGGSNIFDEGARVGWHTEVGTGVARTFVHRVRVPILPGRVEVISVYARPSVDFTSTGQSGAVVATHGADVIENAVAFTGLAPAVAVGDAIRLEDDNGVALTDWHTIRSFDNGDTQAVIHPPILPPESFANRGNQSGGAATWRTKSVCDLYVRSLSIDEVDLGAPPVPPVVQPRMVYRVDLFEDVEDGLSEVFKTP